ncbi:tetratricopeptide repeat protein [Komagataeibacter kakiaceti]|uniref:tetratricopeptide repeat protein n=1 Tax=Komagataeibacter kakiaceti TaxID=943261 RepID=UPI001F585F77|nr:tetratricopeptide repeat protein [Komagataeibacter kakiaceti]
MASHPEEGNSLCEHISMSLLETGYAFEGLQILSAWLSHMPGTAALLNNMACALERTGHSELAIAWYEKALEIAPDDPTIRFGYALAHLKAGNFHEGGKYYVKRTPLTNGINWWFMSLPPLRHGMMWPERRSLSIRNRDWATPSSLSGSFRTCWRKGRK